MGTFRFHAVVCSLVIKARGEILACVNRVPRIYLPNEEHRKKNEENCNFPSNRIKRFKVIVRKKKGIVLFDVA